MISTVEPNSLSGASLNISTCSKFVMAASAYLSSGACSRLPGGLAILAADVAFCEPVGALASRQRRLIGAVKVLPVPVGITSRMRDCPLVTASTERGRACPQRLRNLRYGGVQTRCCTLQAP